MTIKDSSGSSLGNLKDATFRSDGNVEFFIIEHGLIFKKQKQLPGDHIDTIDDKEIKLKIGAQEFKMMRDIGDEA